MKINKEIIIKSEYFSNNISLKNIIVNYLIKKLSINDLHLIKNDDNIDMS